MRLYLLLEAATAIILLQWARQFGGGMVVTSDTRTDVYVRPVPGVGVITGG